MADECSGTTEEKHGPSTSVEVVSLAGDRILEVSLQLPVSVVDVKRAVTEAAGLTSWRQKILHEEAVLGDADVLPGDGPFTVTMLHDDSSMLCWDIEGNPDAPLLEHPEGNEQRVKYTRPNTDYTHVMTREPIDGGRHYFEFVMEFIGDEQWCGLVPDKQQAGHPIYPTRMIGSFFYCGRRWEGAQGGLQLSLRSRNTWGGNHTATKTEKVVNGDVIGVLVDVEKQAVSFTLNGTFQFACQVPKGPLYLSTTLDRPDDAVELRLAQSDPPQEAIDGLDSPVLFEKMEDEED